MKVIWSRTPEELGQNTAKYAASLLRRYLMQNGTARLLLSTGVSQFTTLSALVKEPLDWDKVEVFHLDEYIGLPRDHPASFVKYLRERFVDIVKPGKFHCVDTTGDVDELIAGLTREVRKSPIDVGLIGIGENAHIAFNDPPADFDSEQAFIVVELAESCRLQQLGENWFPTLGDVPGQSVTMTVRQILKCRHIISAVPFKVKAKAIHDTLTAPGITPMIPATALRKHDDVTIYVDEGSASMIDEGMYSRIDQQ
jgi:glucosamine-6-phosphate deaminase